MDRDDATLDTFWQDMEKLCGQAVPSSAPTEAAASDPPPGPPPPGPPPPGPPPPGPPPPAPPPPISGVGGMNPPSPEKMTKVAKSRAYKPQGNLKMIDKVHWSKVSRAMATNKGVIWQKAAEGEMDSKVDVDPASVEELFAKPNVKQVEEKTKPVDEKGKTTKVMYLSVN